MKNATRSFQLVGVVGLTVAASFAQPPAQPSTAPPAQPSTQPAQGTSPDGKQLELKTIKIDPSKVMKIDPTSVKPGSIIQVPIRKDPQFSNDEAKAVADLLSGSWKTQAPVAVPGGQPANMVISAGPIFVRGLKDVIYVEMAREDGLHRPYRHLVWHLVNIKGQWNLQSLEFRRSKGELPSAVGFFGASSGLPIFSGDDLVATMSIPLTKNGDSLTGKTAFPYPTQIGGAVEMTSEISISPTNIEVADRGFDAEGKQVWGPAAGERYTFVKGDVGVKSVTEQSGLVSVTYPTTLTGEAAKDGELVSVNYIGYLPNGTIFDSSFERNAPFQYAKGTKLIEGWSLSMADAQAGMRRRIYVPFGLGYGERARGKIPAMSDLVFELEVLKVEPAPAAPAVVPGAVPAAPGQPAIPGQIAPKMEVTDPPAEIKEKMEADIRRRMEERAKKEADEAAQKAAEATKNALPPK